MAPDAVAVSQACAYVVLSLIGKDTKVTSQLTQNVVEILVSAGYRREAVVDVVARLSQGTARRRAMWTRSQKHKLTGAIVAAISDLT